MRSSPVGNKQLFGFQLLEKSSQAIDLYQEVGYFSEAATHEHEFDIGSANERVVLRFHVVPPVDAQQKSRGYLAAIRRRRCQAISRQVSELSLHADSDDLVIHTHAALTSVRELIQELTVSGKKGSTEIEGNTCQILRIIRDTFMNGGWNRYREAKVRDVVLRIIKRLCILEDVVPGEVDEAADLVLDLDLNTAIDVAFDELFEE